MPPTKLVNRYVKKKELDFYFEADSVEELIMNLTELRRRGFLDLEIKLDKDYIKWQQTRGDFKVNADKLINPPDPFGLYNYSLRKDEYQLGGLYYKIRQETPLNERELVEVFNKLPRELTERYIDIKIFDLDRDELKMLIPKVKNKKQSYGEASYKGLKISGAEVTYLNKQIQMPFRERETLRVFLKRPETILSSDEFTANVDIFNPKKLYSNPHKTFSQLVSDLRAKLIPIVKQRCIYNVASEGWRLIID